MSEEQEHIDHRVTYLFNQDLTQAEIALHLAITDNIHIYVRNLRRHLARLQLYWQRNLSEPNVIDSIPSCMMVRLATDGSECLLQEPCTIEHNFRLQELVPFISQVLSKSFSSRSGKTMQAHFQHANTHNSQKHRRSRFTARCFQSKSPTFSA